ncbi:MAG: efflux RND transporter periplasmic adaptor subunit [Vampirovibrionales bacterium]|nr:efflux RND transporter periplasmic adaptor subunit [Vampirovibrionales bacterium]
MKLIFSLVLLAIACIALVGALVILPEKESLTVTGLVQAREMKDASRFGGRIKTVLVREGDRVTKGQTLLTFDNSELLAKIAQAQADLTQTQARAQMISQGADATDIRQAYSQVQQSEDNLSLISKTGGIESAKAQAALQAAQVDYDKALAAKQNAPQMLSEGIISQQKFNEISAQFEAANSAVKAARQGYQQASGGARRDQLNIARARVDASRANYQKLLKGANREELTIALSTVDQAKSQLAALKAQLSEMEMHAKISGQVTILDRAPGDLALPGVPVVSIIDYTDLWSDIYVPENKLYMARAGQRIVAITSAYDKRTKFDGAIAYVNPQSAFVPSGEQSNSGEQSAFRVKVRLNAMDRSGQWSLYPGMKVKIKLTATR